MIFWGHTHQSMCVCVFRLNVDIAVSGVDRSVKILKPTPWPLEESENGPDERIRKRRALAIDVSYQPRLDIIAIMTHSYAFFSIMWAT